MIITEAHDQEFTSTGTSSSDKWGIKFETLQDIKVYSVTKDSTCTAETAYITDSSLVVLGSAAFVGNVATFNGPVEISEGQEYYALADGSSTKPGRTNTNVVFKIKGTLINWTAGRSDVADSSSRIYSISSIDIRLGDQTNSTAGTRGINKNFPVTEGILAGQKQTGRITNLVAQEGTVVARRLRKGL